MTNRQRVHIYINNRSGLNIKPSETPMLMPAEEGGL